ncbi:four helix bundle protein [Chryseolinea sp. H1M3-3]|uniref:four helix bundle protein n=1 Tax=Chryseolinea sp. H1M3-3 TaxID=3034144 RepID=UPI0023ED1412|nr:four helix bundle protein [Chryseolinea sp. H1M3-3]
MSKVTKFEDLRCWQEARKLVKEIYLVSEHGKLAKDFDTKSQIKRAALSTMNNIAEGFGKFSAKEFIRYLDTASNSVSEVKSILYVLHDLNYLEQEKTQELQAKSDEVKALTVALIKYLVNRRDTSTPKHINT